MSCSVTNSQGIRCPRVACCDGLCNVHTPINLEPDIEPVVTINAELFADICTYVGTNGERCTTKSTDHNREFCDKHLCAHGKSTFRHERQCFNQVVEKHKYCELHKNSCDHYCSEDDTGFPICCEDIYQCDKPIVTTTPKRLCQYHHQLYLFQGY